MVMKNKVIDSFKEALHKAMIENFENDGELTPILFFIKDNQPMISNIPYGLLSTPEGKEILAKNINEICLLPNVICAGIIIEAYGARIEKDSDIGKLVSSGNVRISELKERVDIIMMTLSTPEGDEVISYEVDCDNKTVGKRFIEDGSTSAGRFSNFFKWTQN